MEVQLNCPVCKEPHSEFVDLGVAYKNGIDWRCPSCCTYLHTEPVKGITTKQEERKSHV